MRKIILSFLVIAGATAAIGVGGTTAFFSDTETSTGNTFAAGAIDLKIDNESYYNGAVSTSTSWTLADLSEGQLFFNFQDLKPDDEGEDTISLHVNDNDAWACMDVTLTSNDDNSSNESELATPDAPEDINNTWDGELAQNIQMFWWADDGDNVFEAGENTISNGVQTLYELATTSPFSVPLADASGNVWGGTGPISGGETHYIGKSWCFGSLSLSAIPQDGIGHTASSTNGPLVRGTGVICNGEALNNLTQTDGATLDVAFRAIQSRNNPQFSCGGDNSRLATLTVIKVVTNDNGGNNVVPDFQLFADNGTTEIGVTSGSSTVVLADTYTITETGVSGYVASFSGDCDADGSISLAPGDNKTCTITNNDLPGNITLVKNVINDGGGTATANSAWGLKIDGSTVPNNTSVAVTANVAHTINETGRTGYHFVSITGNPKCPAVLGGTATLDEGEAITCTITNDDN